MERLQKFIASTGICSRRRAEELIKDGKVKVNGVVVREMGVKVSSSDSVEVLGKLVEKENKEYYLLNKPRGYVTTTSDDKLRKTVVDLIDTDARIYPVGRLDYDTTGVLLLTNDGEFANILMHPKSEIDKVYVAKLEGIITGEAINKLKNGVELEDGFVRPSRVKLKKVNKDKNTSIVSITIHEGRNHIVKRMFKSVGYSVSKLTREKMGIFTVDDLKSGEYRKLSLKEVQKVYSLKK